MHICYLFMTSMILILTIILYGFPSRFWSDGMHDFFQAAAGSSFWQAFTNIFIRQIIFPNCLMAKLSHRKQKGHHQMERHICLFYCIKFTAAYEQIKNFTPITKNTSFLIKVGQHLLLLALFTIFYISDNNKCTVHQFVSTNAL